MELSSANLEREQRPERNLLERCEFIRTLDMPLVQIWMYPETSDLSPRRSVQCATLVRQLTRPEADDMRRRICGKDFCDQEKGHGLFDSPMLMQYPALFDDLFLRLL